MDYTSSTATEMPSPKSKYFKVTMANDTLGESIIKWTTWANNYKAIKFYAVKKTQEHTLHLFAFTEEKLAANLITLLNTALGDSFPAENRPQKAEKMTGDEMLELSKSGCFAVMVNPTAAASDACKMFSAQDDTTSKLPLEDKVFSFDFTIKNMKTIDTVVNDKNETLVLRTFDMVIPMKNEASAPYRIRSPFPVLLQGISVESGDFKFFTNTSLYGDSSGGYLSTEVNPDAPHMTHAQVMQTITYGAIWDMISKNFKTPENSPKYTPASWLELHRVDYPVLHGVEPGNTLILHCASVFRVYAPNTIGTFACNFMCWNEMLV